MVPIALLGGLLLLLGLTRSKMLRQCCCVLCYYAWCCCCCAGGKASSGRGSSAKDVSTDFEMAERRGDGGSARKARTPSRRGDIRLDDDDDDDEDEEASLLAEVGVDDFEADVNPFAAPTP